MKPNKKTALAENKNGFNKEKMRVNHNIIGNGGGNPSGLRASMGGLY
jgi:hypothetical protein